MYSQVFVWEGCCVTNGTEPCTEEEFVGYLQDEFGCRGKYLEEVRTLPDSIDGRPIKCTGGRNDLFFSIHDDDLRKFLSRYRGSGIQKVEGLLGIEGHRVHYYPVEVVNRYII